MELAQGFGAIIAGITVFAIGTAFAYNCGYPLNPARDFGPRLFTLIAGWGVKTFTAGNYYFWIPIVGPMTGAFVGTILYTITISSHLNLI